MEKKESCCTPTENIATTEQQTEPCCTPVQKVIASQQKEPCCSPSDEDLKAIVKEKYGRIASNANADACCGDNMDYSIMSEDYTELEGYAADADLKLGCGLPTEFAQIKPGNTVVDLGSGAGNDCFIARAETGETGQVIGVDFTPAMIDKARANVKRLGYDNVRFVYGDIDDIPLDANIADVVVSNCVFNLVPNKVAAFSETYRILKPGGHISISDIVLEGDLPDALKEAASMYAGCVSGAIQMEDYLNTVRNAGFESLTIQKKRGIELPESILAEYLSPAEIANFNKTAGIYSITVYAKK